MLVLALFFFGSPVLEIVGPLSLRFLVAVFFFDFGFIVLVSAMAAFAIFLASLSFSNIAQTFVNRSMVMLGKY